MTLRATLALASTLAALGLLALTAAPALAATQPLKVTVTGPGSVSASKGGIAGCTEAGGASCEAQYAEGAKVNLTALPTERSTFAGWTVVGHPGACTRAECEVTINGAREVRATFTPIAQQKLTVAKLGTGEGTVTGTVPSLEFTPIDCVNGTETCEASYDVGAKITLTAAPANEKTAFTGWSGGVCSGIATTCEVEMGAARSVQAEFEPIAQESLKVLTTEGAGEGTVTGSQPGAEFTPIDCVHGTETCEASYDQGAKITLTASPNERSTFAGWTVEAHPGLCPGNAITCEVTLSAATEVKAKFEPIAQEALTVANPGTGPGAGTITGTSPGGEFTPIECGNGPTTCKASYNQGATIVLFASANERSTFAHWQGCESETGNECTLTLVAATEVKAVFDPKPQEALSVGKSGPGTVDGSQPGGEFTPIECGPTCSVEYDQGAQVTLYAYPAERSTFDGWQGCESENGNECTVTLAAATEVTAKFPETTQQKLTLSVKGPGTVDGSQPGGEFTPIECGNGPTTCKASYNQGATIVLYANHPERSEFAGWTGCPNQLSQTECEVTLNAATEVKAQYTPIAQQTLQVEATGEGTVDGSQPGGEFTPIECGNGPTTCEASYNQGAKITLTANRALHNKFTGWEDCPHVISTNAFTPSECEVADLTAATEVKAKFAPVPQANLEVEVTGPGEISSSPAGISCTEGAGTCHESFDTEGPEATVTLTATPNPDNHLEKWEGACTGDGTCEVTMSAAKSVKPVFVPTLHDLAVNRSGSGVLTSSPAGIDCNEDLCRAEFQEGSTVTLTAHPALHSHFHAWGAGECKGEPSPTECEVEIGPDTTEVAAEFAPIQHSLLVTPQGGGFVNAAAGPISACAVGRSSCSGEYDEASTVTLTASPFAHHLFHAWSGCTHEPSADVCEVQIGLATTEVTAEFVPIEHTLTLTPTGAGRVTADSGSIKACESAAGICAGEYVEASTVTLTATPAPHQAVAWSGCARATENTCEAEIGAADSEVRAAFAPITHALTLTRAGTGQGQVSCNGTPCAARYPEGTALTLAATPAAGSTFAGWSGAGCSGTATCQLTLDADATLTATFTANPPAEEHCVVPKLAGKTLAQARAALSAAHCSLGTVTKPKKEKGALAVKSSSPGAGTTLPANGQVNLKLRPKPKKKGKK